MIWLVNFPLPPSVNEYLMPVAGRWSIDKKGKSYRKGHFVKTKLHSDYLDRCKRWRMQHKTAWEKIQYELIHMQDLARLGRQPFALRVDCFFAFEHSRLWTQTGEVQSIDSDNRLKPCRDALAKLLGIDDKYFFSGFFEKVSTRSKELECSILRISQMTPRTLDDLKTQIKMENSPASS
ncbi:Crossover junction endodeoxyribonuclease, RusA-like [uncultured Caudovirales phage]|uniref:Crossover junction endodeoxyribonuclease, RusA-like n=1 Tax=uncultured Caudovirales phage TaxID=2100421 RepID=A0A6J5MV96_9CAUD|nr:Crossover junction endodeoxyribonuclease, RusA-like [uncultured Caudovirales phage]